MPSSCASQGQVAVCFDEGPSQYTNNVLISLDASQTKATFHVITAYLNNVVYSTLLTQIVQAGHLLGMRYPTTLDPNTQSDDQIVQTLLDQSQIVYSYTSVYPKYLRLPYGDYSQAKLNLIQNQGFFISFWNLDVLDYNVANVTNGPATISGVYQTQFAQVGAGAGRFIALHHDIYPVYTNPNVIPQVVAAIKNNGYTAVRLDTCLNDKAPYRLANNDVRGKISTKTSDAASSTATSFLLPLMTVIAMMLVLALF